MKAQPGTGCADAIHVPHAEGIFPYEKEEQEKLVAAFTEQKGNKLRLRYGWGAVLILEAGCRAVAALAWNGVDEEKRTLRANKNMVRVDGRTVVQRTTKTASGRRTVPLNSKAMEDIRNLRGQQVAGCPYVFATRTGEHASYRRLPAPMERASRPPGLSTAVCMRCCIPLPATYTPGEWK